MDKKAVAPHSPFCRHASCVRAILKGFVAGLAYGAKVRFPHALVITLVFRRSGSLTSMIPLGCSLRHIRQTTDDVYNQLIAGGIAGSIVFGSGNPIHTQINLYLLSRIILACINLAIYPAKLNSRLFAGACWSAVMALFFVAPRSLQASLKSSMDTLYVDTDKDGLFTFRDLFK
ncbi:unnamed protein product (mitochondrion) [Plasmodiophora brassicae]|uniref:Transmembrane protein 135 N-terminal domain-containing protein n=1 Tax=Plasmodiophora brassicae TaxID=37360 RepID=A0A3P3YHM2_PLABS|nr:unnamed protein product [Plasmodiophora brassicae]